MIERDSELAENEYEQGRRERDHDARVDPVVQMRDPSDHEFRESGELVVDLLLAAEECGFGEVIRRARSGFRIQIGKFRVRERGQEGD